MSSKRKKISTFSASDIRQKFNSGRPKRSRSAGKASRSRDNSIHSNPELDTVSDGHLVSSAITMTTLAHNSKPTVAATTVNSDKTVTAEDYSGVLQPNSPAFDNSTIITKTNTERRRKMRKNDESADINPNIPVGSDCGSLYPNPGYSQADINMALSDKLDRIEKENRDKLDKI